MHIMANEPAHGMTAAEVESYFADKHTGQDLADAYAVAHNQFWWVEDNRYDYQEGTPEHQAACHVTNEWRRLMNQYQEEIFAILRSEGFEIPNARQITVLAPFMKKYGYEDQGGWWIREAR